MLIDTHGHVNFNAFKEDAKKVLENTLKNNIWVIMPGSQLSTSERAVRIAEEYKEGVYAAVGIHPIHLGKRRVDSLEVESEESSEESWRTFETRAEEFDLESYRLLAKSKKTVAIGEVGLDYYYQPKGKARRSEMKVNQLKILQQQVELALELNLPVIFHCRVAHDDLIAFIGDIQKQHKGVLRGVIHSYTGTKEQADKFMELGMYIGLNGLIFKDVAALPDPIEVISHISLERIVLETDSPYLTPPQSLTERNEPLNVRYVAERVAEIKKFRVEEIAKATTQNAKNLFSL
ncbi:MAG: TatD family hydrolase [Patescibacteria group bacterium]|nr:TatD family hydrolase [Patescibacteria group bacterium]